MKTAEALIAIVMSLIFLVLVFSYVPKAGLPESGLDILAELRADQGFRDCTAIRDINCIDEYLDYNIPMKYSYKFFVNSSQQPRPAGLSEKGVMIESTIISGNASIYDPAVITLYYWREPRHLT